MDWELICQQKQTQINKDNIRENSKIVEHDYKVGDKFMLNNHADIEYEMPYRCPFEIKHCCKNVTVTIQCGVIKTRYNIRHINPYTSDTKILNVEN